MPSGTNASFERREIEEARDDAPRRADVDGGRVAGRRRRLRRPTGGTSRRAPIARESRRPTSLSTNCGDSPSPGLLLVSIARVMVVCAGMSVAATRLLPRTRRFSVSPRVIQRCGTPIESLDLAKRADLFGELRRLEARLVVGAAHRAVERQVALEQARAHRDGGEGDGGAGVVARIADRAAATIRAAAP